MTHRLISHPRSFLTESDEKIIVARMLAGDQSARDDLISSHLPLARKCARRYLRIGRMDDRVQDASVALCEAADTFDPTKGARFSTWALLYIRAALATHARKNFSMVSLPASQRAAFSASLRAGTAKFDASLDVEIPGRRMTFVECIRDESAPDEDDIAERIEADERRAMVAAALRSLSRSEQAILCARHLTDNPDVPMLKEIGTHLGISRQRVQQIEIVALAKFKASLRRQIIAREYRQHERRAAA
jgi:RNA polymerase sigma-32 factor